MPEEKTMPEETPSETTPVKNYENLRDRVGRFSISVEFVRDTPAELLKLLAMMEIIVLRCEHFYHLAEFQYIGLSPYFAERVQGGISPKYAFTFDKSEDGSPILTGVDQTEELHSELNFV